MPIEMPDRWIILDHDYHRALSILLPSPRSIAHPEANKHISMCVLVGRPIDSLPPSILELLTCIVHAGESGETITYPSLPRLRPLSITAPRGSVLFRALYFAGVSPDECRYAGGPGPVMEMAQDLEIEIL